MKHESLFDEITRARKILELPEAATMEEIKRNYRRLLKKWHPDRHGQSEKSHEMTDQIIKAHKTILEYCRGYRFSFLQDDVEKYISESEWWFKRFGSDPLWGK